MWEDADDSSSAFEADAHVPQTHDEIVQIPKVVMQGQQIHVLVGVVQDTHVPQEIFCVHGGDVHVQVTHDEIDHVPVIISNDVHETQLTLKEVVHVPRIITRSGKGRRCI